jgi:NADPH:quinone reductase-like Zn-dependent oxidoreductase
MPSVSERPEAPTAIQTHLAASFVSLELSRSIWLITSLSPGSGEKMSKHSVRAGDVAALQIAKMTGGAVIATSSSDEKLERVRALGADHVINYRQVPDWGKRVRDLTGGGVDHVVEVGGPGALAQSITAVRVGGHISLIGVLTGRQGEVPTVYLMAKQARLQGLMVGSRRQQQDYVAALGQ